MKLQKQIAKNRVVLALPVALLMAANAWSADTKKDVYFINERGRLSLMTSCTLIDAAYLEEQLHTTVVNTSVTCFFVDDTLEYSGHFSLTASDVTFIISDKAKFTINYNSSDNNTNAHALHASGNLKIFGQKNQAGSLIVNETGSNYSRGLSAGGTLQIYGGHVTATSNARDAIWANGNIDIYGGYISATGAGANTNYVGIKSETGNINVNWVNSLYADSYKISSGKAIKIADGLTLTDGSNKYSGSNPSIAGKTLTPTDFLVQFVTNADNSKRAIINGEYSGEAVNIPSETVIAIDYNRSFTEGVPATIVLPFSLQEGATTNAKFYRLKQVVQVQVDGACAWNASAQNIATDPDENASKRPTANEPYIVILNEGYDKLEFYLSTTSVTFAQSNNPTTEVSEGAWQFIGVYSYKVWNDPNDGELGLAYAFAGSNENNIKQGKFGKIAIAKDAATTGYPYANPFRAYLKKRDSNVKLQCPQAPQAVLGRNSAQYSIGHTSESIDVQFIDEDENGGKTTFMARMNTRTGEFTMLPNYDAKGRKIAAPKVRGAYYGKKVLKNKDVK